MHTELNDLYTQEEFQRNLSGVNHDFLEYINHSPGGLKRESFKELELNSQLFTLQPWPTFVSRKYIEEFKTAGETIWQLFKAIPQRIFNNDTAAMSRFYELPQKIIDIQMDGVTNETLKHLVSRGDFILSNGGLKCLEFNVTPNLGGWQISIWESLYRRNSLFSGFLKTHKVKTFNQDLLVLFLSHILELIKQNPVGSNGDGINIAFTLSNYDEQAKDPTRDFLNAAWHRLLKKHVPSTQGDVIMCDRKRLQYKNDRVYIDGKLIDTMVEFQHGMVSPSTLNVFKAGNVKLINGPICQLLGSKLNLALLSDYERYDVYSKTEQTLIDRYIPWSRKVEPGKTTFHSDTVDLEPFLLKNRENMVLKPSRGLGGEDVCVGRKTPQEEWEKAIAMAMEKRSFVVQEYIQGDHGIYQAGDQGCMVHDMVWGFFLFGPSYCGAWVRVMPSGDHKGVINCHQGATVSGIFEVDQ